MLIRMLRPSIAFLLLLAPVLMRAQTFWTEDFNNSCSASCQASAYTSTNGSWSVTNTGVNGADANVWYVSCAENGHTANVCGSGCAPASATATLASLHVGSAPTSMGDIGAAYDAGGLCGFWTCPQTNKRVESPVINCTGQTNITLAFNYIEAGDGTLDDASLWYDAGSGWTLLANLSKTMCCGPQPCNGSTQGLWTAYSIVLPAACDNNPNVRIGFNWTNNDDGVGTDPSFAVDDITLSTVASSAPVAAFTPSNANICAGDCISFTDNSTNSPTSWSWSFPGAATTSSTSQNPTNICYNTAGTYTVTLTATNASGSNSTTQVITVNPNPTVTVTPASPSICAGSSVLLTATGATSYSWSPATNLSSTTTDTATASPAATQTYTVTGTTGSCSGTQAITVTVNPNPSATVSPLAAAICAGDSVSITAAGGTTYSWLPATGLSTASGPSVSASPASTQTYTVTVSNAQGCQDTVQITITVNPLPAVTVTPSSPTMCPGDSVTLTASGASTYLWSPTTALNTTTGSTVIAQPPSTTTYTVTGTSTAGCTDTQSVAVTVNNSLSLTASPASPSICPGDSVSITASGATSYTWSPATGLSSASGATVTASPAATTVYTITGTSGSCSATQTVTVTVSSGISVSISPASASVCAGDTVSLTASGATSYTWTPSTGLNTTTGATVIANPTTATTYSVIGTSGSCTDTNTVTVNITPPPTVSVTSSSPTMCSGSSVTLTATGATSYTWSPATGLSATTGSSVTASPSTTTTYSIIGGTGACSDTTTITVNVTPTPTVTATPASPTICAGDNVSITVNGATSYTWSPSTGLSSTTGSTVTANPSSTITYSVIGTDGTCSDTLSITVTVNPCSMPIAAFSSSETSICEGSCVDFTDESTNATSWIWSFPGGNPSSSTSQNPVVCYSSPGIYDVTLIAINSNGSDTATQTSVITVGSPTSVNAGDDETVYIGNSTDLNATGTGINFSWDPPTGLSCTDCQSPTASPLTTTAYVVTMIDDNGCVTSDTVVVIVEEKYEFFMPTGFSPNGDGRNDVLYVRGNGIQWIKLLVFDRVGEKVWEAHSTTEGWDGTFRGQPMNSGVFVYYLEVQFYSGQRVKKEGDITLVR